LVVLLVQPLYFLSLASLGTLAPRERTIAHLSAAFEQGVLADDGAPRALLWKGGEQLTECISVGIGLNKAESAWQSAITGAYPMAGDMHACTGLHKAVAGGPTTSQPYFRYWHGYRVALAPLVALFPLWFVKLLNALLVAAACVALARTLCHRCGAAVAVIVVASFLCLSDDAAMAVAIALAAVVLSMPQRPTLADLRLHVGLMTARLRRIAAKRPR
jgi:hypothetical protein